MAEAANYVTIPTTDGAFEAHLALPSGNGGRGPGLLLFQEIFGVNDNMRAIAGRLARLGYVVLVPDMFWRIQPRFEQNDDSDMPGAFAMMQQFDLPKAFDDIDAAHAYLRSMDGCTGKIGAMGFCLGGGLAFATALLSRADGHSIDAAVSYYGSMNNQLLEHVGKLECPVLFQYGTRDGFIPNENIDEVERATAHVAGVEFCRYDAGHAFSNWDTHFYDATAADAAWPVTEAFLAKWLR